MKSPFATATDRFGQDLVEITHLPFLRLDLRYSTQNNFMKENLYQGFKQAFLHRDAYEKFSRAGKLLQEQKAGYRFLLFDALRPRSVQRKMFQFVASTPMKDYVADPELGSMHNFGMAIDLSLLNERGQPLDMGTDFDDFSQKAQPQLEEQLLQAGELSAEQIANRRFLRQIMEQAGFLQLPHEWWHYNALPAEKVRGIYKIVE